MEGWPDDRRKAIKGLVKTIVENCPSCAALRAEVERLRGELHLAARMYTSEVDRLKKGRDDG